MHEVLWSFVYSGIYIIDLDFIPTLNDESICFFQRLSCWIALTFILMEFFSLFFCNDYAPLAQLVEHLTLNQGVPGSNP